MIGSTFFWRALLLASRFCGQSGGDKNDGEFEFQTKNANVAVMYASEPVNGSLSVSLSEPTNKNETIHTTTTPRP